MVDGRQQSSAEMADDEANRKLIRIGGVASVHMEFNDLHAGKASREVESRKYRPQLTMAILILAATHRHEFMFYASGHLVLEVVLHSYPLITAMANAATTLVSVCAEEGNSSLKVELKCSLVSCLIDEVEDEDGSEDKEELFTRLPFA
ncbi:uncharacterized protein LOC117904808 isoform X2 [Vitis riparia]|uniref:uncharacterized protein LOC117904808 isoform X2 n=1 Tax=Vitis riparia TaxID=96939 RepID=UPI00155A4BE2|nr:uncharacterized protein LOC117904808 isoform X2 [Vitis riparia]